MKEKWYRIMFKQLVGIVCLLVLLQSPLLDGVKSNLVGTLQAAAATTPGNGYVETYYHKELQKYVYNCTWYAWERAYQKTGIKLPMWGNGGQWADGARRSGYIVSNVPKANSLVVWQNGGAGHVGFVESVSGNNVTITEAGSGYGACRWITQNINEIQNRTYDGKLAGFIYLKPEDTPFSGHIDTPANSTTVSGDFTISGWANGGNKNFDVNFYLDQFDAAHCIKNIKKEELLYREDIQFNGGFSFSFNSVNHPLSMWDGEHILYMVITDLDNNNNKTTISNNIKIKNKLPQAAIDNPVASTIVSNGSLLMSGWGLGMGYDYTLAFYLDKRSSNNCIKMMNQSELFYRTDLNSTCGYKFNIDVSKWSNGIHKIILVVKNTEGNEVVKEVYINVKNKSSVNSINLNRSSLTLSKKNEKTTLVATLTPANATNKKVTWKSSSASVATVDQNGLVIAKGNGTANITVTTQDGNKTALCKVTVKIPAPVKVTAKSVSLNKKSITLYKGKTYTLKAIVTPNNYKEGVSWSSSNKNATVSKNGKVTGNKAGKSTITVRTTNNKSAYCNVVVKEIKSKSVVLNKKSLTLYRGKKYTLKATVKPANTTDRKSWSTSNKKYATVTSKGTITAVRKGSCNITVKMSNGKKAICKVTIK